jgi:DNA-binding XRE family transcriptional regulator
MRSGVGPTGTCSRLSIRLPRPYTLCPKASNKKRRPRPRNSLGQQRLDASASLRAVRGSRDHSWRSKLVHFPGSVPYRHSACARLSFRPMVGGELRRLRERAKLTQEQLLFRARLSRQYISLLELNRKSPTLNTLFLSCDALDASAANLVKRADAARKRKPGG